MARCPSCGKEATGKFCPSCGSPVPQDVAAAAMPTPPPTPGGHIPGQPGMLPGFQPPQPGMPPQGMAPGYPPHQPGAYPGMPPQPQQGSGVLKWVLIGVGGFVGLIILIFVLAAAFGDDDVNYNPPNPPANNTTKSAVGTPKIASKVNEDTQEPLDTLTTVPANTRLIYAAVQVRAKTGETLGARWHYEGKLQSHLNTEIPVDRDYEGWAAFHISNGDKAWPAGTYTVEILLNGQKQTEARFSVK